MCMYLDYEYYINGICKYNGSDIFVFIYKIDNFLVKKNFEILLFGFLL